jgi:hypothetical protein
VNGLLPDSGRFYLSTYFDDRWLAVQGFSRPAVTGETVGGVASPAVLIEREDDVSETVRRLAAAGHGDDDVVLDGGRVTWTVTLALITSCARGQCVARAETGHRR